MLSSTHLTRMGWHRRGWKKADKSPVLNRDLWERLIAQDVRHEVRWVKVKGHAGIPMNERVDGLAVAAIQRLREKARLTFRHFRGVDFAFAFCSIHLRMRLSFVFVLLALSACDSGGSAPPPVVPPPVVPPPVVPPPALSSFTLPEVPARLTYEASDRASLTPTSFFGTTGVPRGIYFNAASTGPGVRVATTPTALTIEALTVGVTPITVTLKALGYRDSTVTIPVEVVPSVCPPDAPAGTRDYFPAQANTVWTFGYGSTVNFNSGEIINATLTLTFGAPTCIRGIRTWLVVQRLAGTRRTSNSAPSVPYTIQVATQARETPTNEVEFQISLPEDLPHAVTLVRYRVPTGGGTQGLRGSISCPVPSGSGDPYFEFNPGVGLSREGMTCTTASGTLTRYFVRVP